MSVKTYIAHFKSDDDSDVQTAIEKFVQKADLNLSGKHSRVLEAWPQEGIVIFCSTDFEKQALTLSPRIRSIEQIENVTALKQPQNKESRRPVKQRVKPLGVSTYIVTIGKKDTLVEGFINAANRTLTSENSGIVNLHDDIGIAVVSATELERKTLNCFRSVESISADHNIVTFRPK